MAPIATMHAAYVQRNPKRELVTALVGGSPMWVNGWPIQASRMVTVRK
jgi:hypothetical protein